MILCPSASFAWGHTGHVGISRLAAQSLPAELPAFLRTAVVAEEIGEIGVEPDESKNSGSVTTVEGRVRMSSTVHDAERDPAHHIHVDDSGRVVGGVVPLADLPPTREAFDTALRTGGQTQYGVGYLPYALIDEFQQVRKDFAIWRALSVGLRSATSESDRGWFRFQLQLRERITIRDIGFWSHHVGDASQPMHVSMHHDGWGAYPNPEGFTEARLHAPFEGSFVKNYIDFSAVARAMRPYTDRGAPNYEARVSRYLAETLAQVAPMYRAAKAAGNDDYAHDQPQEHAIVVERLAAGASELRDEIVDAWRQSAGLSVGYPLVRVTDIESGASTVTPATFGSD